MDRALLDTMHDVLSGRVVEPHRTRDALLACLDLVPPEDADAGALRDALDSSQELDRFQGALTELRRRATPARRA